MVELAVVVLLLLVVVEDLRRFRIRNTYVFLLGSAFVADSVLRGQFGPLLSHSLFAAVALAVLTVGFSLRLIGGGDAKLLTVALFWVGPGGASVFAVVLLLLTLATITGAKIGLLPSRRSEMGLKIPFGPSIAGAWLAVLVLSRIL